jgi:hypothetical protein
MTGSSISGQAFLGEMILAGYARMEGAMADLAGVMKRIYKD